jgi:tetratricopeptide (TPR) repeat protein
LYGFVGGTADERDAHCRAALAASRSAAPKWQRIALQALGFAQMERGDRELARETFLRIIALADADGDREAAAFAHGDLGLVLLELGQLDQAEAALREAVTALKALGYERFLAYSHEYNLATVYHEQGDLERAERGYRELVAGGAERGLARPLALAALGALLAARDEIGEAARTLDEAESALAGAGVGFPVVVATHRAQIDIALARRAAREGDVAASETHRAAALRQWRESASLAHMVDDLRTARRWLKRALDLSLPADYPAEAWIVAENGAWFRPPRGWRVDVGSRAKGRDVLRALLRARLDEPERVLSIEELVAAWPSEALTRRAAEARIYTSVKTLRAAGLRDLLSSTAGGYLLDPAQPVIAASPVARSSLAEADASAVLLVGRDARWFQPPRGERTEIARAHQLRRVLGALVRERMAAPGVPMPLDALLRHACPGERFAVPRSGAMRVYVLLSRLRALGLRDVIKNEGDGYVIDPAVQVVLEADPS